MCAAVHPAGARWGPPEQAAHAEEDAGRARRLHDPCACNAVSDGQEEVIAMLKHVLCMTLHIDCNGARAVHVTLQ